MTNRKKGRGPEPRHPLDQHRKALIAATWQTFTSGPEPDGPERSYLIEGRHPLYELLEIFESFEFEVIAFDVIAHRVPSHPPSITPVKDCGCVDCTGRGIVSFGFSL